VPDFQALAGWLNRGGNVAADGDHMIRMSVGWRKITNTEPAGSKFKKTANRGAPVLRARNRRGFNMPVSGCQSWESPADPKDAFGGIKLARWLENKIMSAWSRRDERKRSRVLASAP